MPLYRTPDGVFNYLDQGSGLPWVFQHGLGGDVHQPEAFALPGFRFLSYDARGHGETVASLDPGRLSFIGFDHLGVKSAVIGGISMGAGVALNFALRFPERTRGLILCRPAWLFEPLPKNLEAFPLIARLIEREGLTEGRKLLEASGLFREIKKSSLDSAQSLLRQFERRGAARNYAVLDQMPKKVPNGDPAELKKITAATLVLGNQADPIHPIAYAHRLASLIPTATFREVTSKSIDPKRHVEDITREISAYAISAR